MRDDRGVQFKMNPDAKRALADTDSPVCVHAETLLPWPIRMYNKLFGVAACVVLLILLFTCLGQLFRVRLFRISSIPDWVGIVLVVSFPICVVGGMAMPFFLNFPNRWNRRAAKEIRWCMRCAYSLEGVQTDEDGCTVCPECGAAWKLPEQNEPLA